MSSPVHTLTTSDGARIVWDEFGAGRPILLLPGYAGLRGSFALQAAALAKAGFRAISVDVRHHGDADFPDFGLRMTRQGEDIHELLEHLDVSEAILVAHSMGVSACLAMFSIWGTDRVSKLVAIDQSPRIMNDETWSWGVRGVRWERLEDMARQRIPFGYPDPVSVPTDVATALDDSLNGWDSYPHAAVVQLFIDHFTSDWRDVLPKIDVPTWVVTGRFSPFYELLGQQWFAAQIPDATITVFENSGHAPHLHEPALFNSELLEFVAK